MYDFCLIFCDGEHICLDDEQPEEGEQTGEKVFLATLVALHFTPVSQ